MSGLEAARAAFRDGARALDPDAWSGPFSPRVLRAWLSIQTVRLQPKWLLAASRQTQDLSLDSLNEDDIADWVEAFCAGWVLQASGPFRNAARSLIPRLPTDWRGSAARLAWWRITGEPDPAREALAALSSAPDHVDPDLAVALHLGFLATADDTLRARAVAALGDDPAALPPRAWSTAADLVDLTADAFVFPSPVDPEATIAAAALAAPPLHLEVHWWIEDELREGPMAEAATFPWPALRIRFVRLPARDQIHFVARLDDGSAQKLDDVGVTAAWLESIVARADKSPLLDVVPPRNRRRGGLRR